MHWVWKNCPAALSGQFEGKEKTTTLVLEATATKDNWIWHSYFGTPGCLNDLNVLNRLPLFKGLLAGSAWGVEFEIGGNLYKYLYYLVDGIYSSWSTLIQSKKLVSQDQATSLFTKRQESCRKDIERAFGILQGQFQIVSKPALNCYPGDMNLIMKTCIILHNMIVESRSDATITAAVPPSTRLIPPQSEPFNEREKSICHIEMKSARIHEQLTQDLIQRLWTSTGKLQSSNPVCLESEDDSSNDN
jgi:hypothetical protein